MGGSQDVLKTLGGYDMSLSIDLLAQAAPPELAWGWIVALNLALLAIGLALWGLRNRAAWSLLAVLGMAAGTGLLVWGIVSAAMHEPMPIGSPPAIIGVGAGCLAGAVALLVISFVGRRDSKS